MRIGIESGSADAWTLNAAGLDAIRQRLRALYGESGRLELEQSASGSTTAFVGIPR
jgi:hypothetical protein